MILYNNYDTQIILRDGKYFLRYGEGGAGETYKEMPISKEDAERVMEDINYSLQLVWDYRNKERGLV